MVRLFNAIGETLPEFPTGYIFVAGARRTCTTGSVPDISYACFIRSSKSAGTIQVVKIQSSFRQVGVAVQKGKRVDLISYRWRHLQVEQKRTRK
jgi:hypothetical protein